MGWTADLGEKRSIEVHAKGWLELFKSRLSNSVYGPTTALTIARNEITTTQARPFGSFGVTLGAAPSPDMTNTYTTKTYENKPIYDLLVELSEEQGGFDFEITWDKKFNIYQKIGIQRPEVLFTYPGNVKNITITKDTTKLVNTITARGQGYGDTQLTSAVSDSASQQKYAIRESTLDYSDVSDQTQLTALATSELNLYKSPTVVHDLVFNGNGLPGSPEVGSFHVGDQVPVFVKVLKLYEDVGQYFTIDKIEVSIDNEDGEEVILTFV